MLALGKILCYPTSIQLHKPTKINETLINVLLKKIVYLQNINETLIKK